MNTYNQKLDKYSSMWCTIYTIYHILLFRYWILVLNNFILKSLIYFEKLLVRSPTEWAIFETIYNSFEKAVYKKLWLNVNILAITITSIANNDTHTRWIGMPKYHSWLKLIDDWSFDKDDVDEFLKYSSKTFAHSLAWDWSDGWYLINSDWTKPLKCSLEVLKHMAKLWVIRNKARTIIPGDESTRIILNTCMMMKKAENQWKLKQYLKTNESNLYLPKAKEIFFYGR